MDRGYSSWGHTELDMGLQFMGSVQAIVHGGHTELDMTEQLSLSIWLELYNFMI